MKQVCEVCGEVSAMKYVNHTYMCLDCLDESDECDAYEKDDPKHPGYQERAIANYEVSE